MIEPAFIDALIPVLTLLPITAPNFLLPESILFPLWITSMVFLSSRRFAILVPEPKLLCSPTIESPT